MVSDLVKLKKSSLSAAYARVEDDRGSLRVSLTGSTHASLSHLLTHWAVQTVKVLRDCALQNTPMSCKYCDMPCNTPMSCKYYEIVPCQYNDVVKLLRDCALQNTPMS